MNTNESGIVNEGFSNDNESQPRKPRRQRRRDLGESAQENQDQVEIENNLNNNVQPPKERRRRRKSKQNDTIATLPDGSSNNIGLAEHLDDLCDDIEVPAHDDVDGQNFTTINLGMQKQGGTQGLGDSVYVEGPKRFRQENHDKFIKNKLRETQEATTERLSFGGDDSNELLISTIGINERYHILTTFLLGLFAGLLIMHTIFIFILSGNTDSTKMSFLISYLPLQRPLFILFYIIFIITSISVWDRLNIGQDERKWNSHQAGILLSVILLLIAFLIQNVTYLYDSKFADLSRNSTNPNYITSALSILTIWRILSAVISVLVAISWLIIAIMPTFNGFIEEMRYNLLGTNNKEIISMNGHIKY